MTKDVTCETQGHLWNGLGYCVMCKAVRPDWECSECGEPCNASVPHTCYADYHTIKAALRLANAQRDEYRNELKRLRAQFDRHTGSSPHEPSREYHKWPGEPPHCMSCSCGMTEEQKALAARSVPLEDYLRVHGELMELKYPGSTPSEKSSERPLSVQRAIGACKHDFGPSPDPDGTRCLKGCGAVYQL